MLRLVSSPSASPIRGSSTPHQPGAPRYPRSPASSASASASFSTDHHEQSNLNHFGAQLLSTFEPLELNEISKRLKTLNRFIIRREIASNAPTSATSSSSKLRGKAAVLIPLCQHPVDSSPSILFTLRSANVGTHKVFTGSEE